MHIRIREQNQNIIHQYEDTEAPRIGEGLVLPNLEEYEVTSAKRRLTIGDQDQHTVTVFDVYVYPVMPKGYITPSRPEDLDPYPQKEYEPA